MLLNCGVEKTLESPLDFKENKPVHPKGNQSWIFIGTTDAEAETPILWPPDAKSWLIGKDSGKDAGKDWRQQAEGVTEDELVGWHHRLNGQEFEQTPGESEGQGGKPGVLQSMGSQRVSHNLATEQQQWVSMKNMERNRFREIMFGSAIKIEKKPKLKQGHKLFKVKAE